jgi:hypothetical protein
VTRVRWDPWGRDGYEASIGAFVARVFPAPNPSGRWECELRGRSGDGRLLCVELFDAASEASAKRRARQEARRLGGE